MENHYAQSHVGVACPNNLGKIFKFCLNLQKWRGEGVKSEKSQQQKRIFNVKSEIFFMNDSCENAILYNKKSFKK
jgi:hypothetical protein